MPVATSRMIAASVRLDRHDRRPKKHGELEVVIPTRWCTIPRERAQARRCPMANACRLMLPAVSGDAVSTAVSSSPANGVPCQNGVWLRSGHQQSEERSRSSFINRSSARVDERGATLIEMSQRGKGGVATYHHVWLLDVATSRAFQPLTKITIRSSLSLQPDFSSASRESLCHGPSRDRTGIEQKSCRDSLPTAAQPRGPGRS